MATLIFLPSRVSRVTKPSATVTNFALTWNLPFGLLHVR